MIAYFLLVIVFFCRRSYGVPSEIKQQPHIRLTVFIHGTFGMRAQVKFSTVLPLMRDKIEQTICRELVQAIREDPFFFQTQPIQEVGLIPIDMRPTLNQGATATAFARVFQESGLCDQETKELYYTYGWLGLLSPSLRYREAEKLYDQLQKEVACIRRREPNATIALRLVCYSHGGSVALNLAAVRREKVLQEELWIDELILVGMPVQKETAWCVADPMFKKVYHFYSRKDPVQKMDFFSTQRFFSQRRFKFKHQIFPKNLQQVELCIKTKKFSQCTQHRINRSPNHTELWFFGWTLAAYRCKFPLYPLPFGAIVPAIIPLINQYGYAQTVLDLQMDGTVLIRERKRGSVPCATTWLLKNDLEHLKTVAQMYEPESLNFFAYKAHVRSAIRSIKGIPVKKSCRCLCGAGIC